jgi:hypothetical protein
MTEPERQEAQRLNAVLLALLKVPFPAVSRANPVMSEPVGFLSWNLEADKVLARNDGLVVLIAVGHFLLVP